MTCDRLIPAEWRESVRRDLEEEAARAGLRGSRRKLWIAWQILRVAARFRWRDRGPLPSKHIGRTLMSGLATDLRLALRAFRRQPGSSVAIVLTLALGIGATTAVYAVFNYVLFRPVPGVADEARLISVYVQENLTTPTRTSATHAHLIAMRDHAPALDGLAAWLPSDIPFSRTPQAAPEIVDATRVTKGYFTILGVRPRLGRLFDDDEYETPGRDVAVISERLWRRAFEADPDTVGRTILLNGQPFIVIGVAAAYQGPKRLGEEDLWYPYGARAVLNPGRAATDDRGQHTNLIGRLSRGGSLEIARQQLAAGFAAAGELIVQSKKFGPAAFAGLVDGVGQTERLLTTTYRILIAGAAMLLLLACANVGNLLVARNLRRQRDLALRNAIGASRFRMTRELIVEAVALGLGAVVIGVTIAIGLVNLFRGARLLSYLPALDELAIDWRVAAFAAAAGVVTVVVCGVAPSIAASRAEFRGGLAQSSRVTPRTQRLRTTLVAIQLALSLTLGVCAGLLARTLAHLQAVELGFDPKNVVTLGFAPGRLGYDGTQLVRLFEEIHTRLASAPGISGAAFAAFAPLGSVSGSRARLPQEDDAAAKPMWTNYVSSDYFDVLRIPLRAGRTFTPAEETNHTGRPGDPIVLNELLARSLFGMASPVGRTLIVPQRRGAGLAREVIGVVGNVRARDLREEFRPMAYEPAAGQIRLATMLLRTQLPMGAAVEVAKRVVREIDPALPMTEIGTLNGRVLELTSEEAVLAKLGSVIAVLAVLLALVGLYGAITFFVGERTREIGVRMALGASPRRIIRQILHRVGATLVAGVALGAVLVVPTSRLLEAHLYGVGPLDPVTIGAAIALLTASALVAAWLPARRAARVDPTIALRAE